MNIIAYRGIELKYGAILKSFGYVFILFLSKIFLNEKITKQKIIGISLIIIGNIIYNFNLLLIFVNKN